MTDSKKTPLFQEHVSLGGRMVDFGGWSLPVQYSSILAEHHACRNSAGLFDVSHMGEILVEGEDALELLQYLLCNDIRKIGNGRCQYSAILNESGGVVDDLIVYRFSEKKFLLCVNASNTEKDFKWLTEKNPKKDIKDAAIKNLSAAYGQVAVQGPRALQIIISLSGAAASIKPFHFAEHDIMGIPVISGRTGYTGEDGLEIFAPWEKTVELWNIILDGGKAHGLSPCGLGARDTLRLEAALPLHGHEINDNISALESGLSWIVNFDKGDFIGREALLKEKREGSKRGLVCFVVDDPGIARNPDKVLSAEGKESGFVASGTKSPTLGLSIGTAVVEKGLSVLGTELLISVRGKNLKGHVVNRPFYRRKN